MAVARTFGEIKTDFQNLLNRDDITSALTDQFVRDGINRCTRLLASFVPAFEKETTLTADSNGYMEIPSDFLEIIDFEDNLNSEFVYTSRDRLKHERLQPSVTTGLTQAQSRGSFATRQQPRRLYCRRVDKWEFYPAFVSGDTVTLLYKADPVDLCDDSDYIPILTYAPEAVKYAALVYAADYYQDPERQAVFAEVFQSIIDELKDLADNLVAAELNGSVYEMRPDEVY